MLMSPCPFSEPSHASSSRRSRSVKQYCILPDGLVRGCVVKFREVRSLRPKVGEVVRQQDAVRPFSVVFNVIAIVVGAGLDPTSTGSLMVNVVATSVCRGAVKTGLFAFEVGIAPILVECHDLIHCHYEHHPGGVGSLSTTVAKQYRLTLLSMAGPTKTLQAFFRFARS